MFQQFLFSDHRLNPCHHKLLPILGNICPLNCWFFQLGNNRPLLLRSIHRLRQKPICPFAGRRLTFGFGHLMRSHRHRLFDACSQPLRCPHRIRCRMRTFLIPCVDVFHRRKTTLRRPNPLKQIRQGTLRRTYSWLRRDFHLRDPGIHRVVRHCCTSGQQCKMCQLRILSLDQ